MNAQLFDRSELITQTGQEAWNRMKQIGEDRKERNVRRVSSRRESSRNTSLDLFVSGRVFRLCRVPARISDSVS